MDYDKKDDKYDPELVVDATPAVDNGPPIPPGHRRFYCEKCRAVRSTKESVLLWCTDLALRCRSSPPHFRRLRSQNILTPPFLCYFGYLLFSISNIGPSCSFRIIRHQWHGTHSSPTTYHRVRPRGDVRTVQHSIALHLCNAVSVFDAQLCQGTIHYSCLLITWISLSFSPRKACCVVM